MAGESTRERIIAAAAAEFARKNFAGATTRAIAARAGVNEVTLFRHFGSKQELFQAVLGEVTGRFKLMQELFDGIAARPPREALLAVGRLQLSFFEALLPLFKLRLAGEATAMVEPPVDRFRLRASLAAYFRSLQERGLFRPERDPELAAEAFTTGLIGFLLTHQIRPEDPPPALDEFLETYVDIFLQGMEGVR